MVVCVICPEEGRKHRQLSFIFSLPPKSGLLPESGRGGTEFSGKPSRRRGERRGISKRQGHFQGRARQLTSSAFGRASFSPVAFTGVRPQAKTYGSLEPAVCVSMADRNECLLMLEIPISDLRILWRFAP